MGSSKSLAVVSVTPETLNISERYGRQESRFLLLQADEVVENLEIISLDLERTDGQQILPATAIQTQIPATQLQANEVVKVPLQVDLAKATNHGQFQGMLLVKYEGGQHLIPLTVNVQARPWWPAVILLVGVLIGTSLSDYRSQGLNRDELTLAVGKLRTQVRIDQSLAADQSIPEVFTRRIQTYLVDVEVSLANQDWSKAKAQLTMAQGVWNAWKRESENWLAELDYYQTLKMEVESIGEGIFYGKALQANLRDLYRQIPDSKQSSRLQEKLNSIRQQVDRFHQGEARIKLLSQSEGQFSNPAEKSKWKLAIQNLRQKLHALEPTSKEAFDNWLDETQTVEKDLVDTSQSLDLSAQEIMKARTFQEVGAAKMPPPPTTNPPSLPKLAKIAQWRLRIFNYSSRGVAIIFLSWAGFSELYVNQPTFGNQPLSDYFALLAWGFGAEVTRESVSKVLKNLGVSGDNDTTGSNDSTDGEEAVIS
ncbi:hypothetical protein IQ260_21745 [Leptolyngbya cf. ectocarpi LEGE 11479]|uniref:Uncharacterized protein n=1 Tax=Leptolyngbya cf. ectocarpi LEGE 11479 TaxID=1828722 RepID=A0A928ZXL4_LEPEC|nr:hypothetical protein [Leptolyngbya cf. ectocarpi LEGE 11479]